MFAWRCGVWLLLAVQANGMEAKEEPEEFDDLLSHALAVSLRDACMAPPVPADPDEQLLDDELLAQAFGASLGDPCKLPPEKPAMIPKIFQGRLRNP